MKFYEIRKGEGFDMPKKRKSLHFCNIWGITKTSSAVFMFYNISFPFVMRIFFYNLRRF